MAQEFDFFGFLDCCEAGGDPLMVGHAHRVGAFCQPHHCLRQSNLLFLHHLVILYHIDGCVGGNERDAAQLLVGKEALGDFDDAFAAERLAFQVGTNGDGIVAVVQVKDVHYLEDVLGGDVVQHRAVFDGTNLELCVVF